MIRDLNKRKEIAQMVYNRYGNILTEKDKEDLDNEVGAAFDAYEMALNEITDLISNDKTIKDVVNYITNIKQKNNP